MLEATCLELFVGEEPGDCSLVDLDVGSIMDMSATLLMLHQLPGISLAIGAVLLKHLLS